MIPSALDHIHEIVGPRSQLAVFLDYDGTLTPIASHPQDAWLSDSMRDAVRALAAKDPVAILSGRDLDDVRRRVNIDRVVYGGSHGFDIAGPRGLRRQIAPEFLGILDAAEKELRRGLDGIPGAQVERKRFSVAAHYRNVNKEDVPKVERALAEAAARHPELRRIDGKKVYELLPDLNWDKGKAVLWLLQTICLGQDEVTAIYIGDDRTDEDAFQALQQSGIPILVTEEPRQTAARFTLKHPEEVEQFLRELTARLR